VVRGGNGDDVLVVTRNDGNDTYVGGAGIDTLDTTDSDAAMNVNLHGGFMSSAETGTDSIATVERVITGRGADTISLNTLANTVDAGDGNDTVIVRSDILRDVIAGGAGTDTADYRFYTTGLTIDLAVATSVVVGSGATEATSDTLNGFENATSGSGADTLRGSTGANTLIAGAGNDTVIGGAGNDNLQGGDGNDLLQGDAGADTIATGAGTDTIRYALVADSAGLAVDTITDFVRGSDRIDLSAIDASTAARGDQAFQFIGTSAFTAANQNGSIRYAYDAGTNRTTIQISNDADTAAEMEIVLVGQVALTATDFVL
jgi:Ca2+-binding RTX toxin-like protein